MKMSPRFVFRPRIFFFLKQGKGCALGRERIKAKYVIFKTVKNEWGKNPGKIDCSKGLKDQKRGI